MYAFLLANFFNRITGSNAWLLFLFKKVYLSNAFISSEVSNDAKNRQTENRNSCAVLTYIVSSSGGGAVGKGVKFTRYFSSSKISLLSRLTYTA